MAKRTCLIDGCERPSRTRGWCAMHYRRWRTTGTTERRSLSPVERFWSKVDKSGDCWLWTDVLTSGGYGTLFVKEGTQRRTVIAHRFSYEINRGPIPSGMQIDHLCRVRHCVNPDHLEVVTQQENIARGDAARRMRSGLCLRGHPMLGENLYVNPNTGAQRCRRCDHLGYLRRKWGTAPEF